MNKVDNNIEKLVLDTHVLIWYLEGIELAEDKVHLIEQKKSINQLYISAITIWEVAMLVTKSKLAFSISFNEWLHTVQTIPGLNIIDLTLNILVESCALPNCDHKDPSDRMIIASTREINGNLLTFDQKILSYAKDGYVKIC